jgi:hypothetical protein
MRGTMKPARSLSLILSLSIFGSASCSSESVRPSSSTTAALSANNAIENAALRPFGKEFLAVGGQFTLNEFIRSDVRSRMDEEPAGESDSSFDPSTVELQSTSEEPQQSENPEAKGDEPEHQNTTDEDAMTYGQAPEAKLQWAKKSFGDALKVAPTSNGVIVLYADENLYDINRLISLVEEGRARMSEKAEIPAERIQITFGGYRGVPQVELWVLPQGASLPDFKPEDRSTADEPQN